MYNMLSIHLPYSLQIVAEGKNVMDYCKFCKVVGGIDFTCMNAMFPLLLLPGI